MPHHNKKWVIIFLIYADFRTKDAFPMNEEMKVELDLMFKEILTTPIKQENSRVFVVLNGIKFEITTEEGEMVQNKTLFYEIENPENKSHNQIGHFEIIESELYPHGSPNPNRLQDPKFLSEVLSKTNVKQQEEVFLITWDHGSAFGIFREESFLVRTSIEDELDMFPYLKEFWMRAISIPELHELIIEQRKTSKDILIQYGHQLFEVDPEYTLRTSFIQILNSKELVRFLEIAKDNENIKLIFRNRLYQDFYKLQKDHVYIEGLNDEESLTTSLTGNVNEILRNDELAEALRLWLGSKKVGVLLMMNCWMMNLHAIYSLKDCVQFLVAPQGDISSPGYNYGDILRGLNSVESYFSFMNPQGLAKLCVDTCHNSVARIRAKEHADKIDEWIIIAMHLNKKDSHNEKLAIENQLAVINNLIGLLVSKLMAHSDDELKYMIKYIRSLSFDFTVDDAHMIDIINFYSSLNFVITGLIPSNPNLREITNEILKVIDLPVTLSTRLMVEQWTGPLSYTAYTRNALTIRSPTGYSLFFPHGKFNDTKLIDSVKSDSLLTICFNRWKTLLTCIYPDINF